MNKNNLIKCSAALGIFCLGVSIMGTAQADILEDVKSRDTLRCGVSSDKIGFSSLTDDGQWHGMDVDLCRSIAAAVLGDSTKVDFVVTTSKIGSLHSHRARSMCYLAPRPGRPRVMLT